MNTNKHESEEGIKLAGIFVRVHAWLPRRRDCEGGFIRGAPVVSLAQTQCAALIESMFGVTTSDDYRPVAWMGRYPVDVTTMLVGLHVVCAVLACILIAIPGLGGTLNYFVFDSARIWNGLHVRPRSGAFYRAARLYWALSYFAGCARGAANGLGSLAAVGAGRFARVALWNFCCLRHHLSAGRVVSADHDQMGCPDSCCSLHPSTAGVSRLERPDGGLGKHRRGVPFH